jgi:hypothetical protein
MSDMPDSEYEMLMGLSKALAIDWDRNDGYGPFVPNVLRADSYNFGFEFMVLFCFVIQRGISRKIF